MFRWVFGSHLRTEHTADTRSPNVMHSGLLALIVVKSAVGSNLLLTNCASHLPLVSRGPTLAVSVAEVSTKGGDCCQPMESRDSNVVAGSLVEVSMSTVLFPWSNYCFHDGF